MQPHVQQVQLNYVSMPLVHILGLLARVQAFGDYIFKVYAHKRCWCMTLTLWAIFAFYICSRRVSIAVHFVCTLITEKSLATQDLLKKHNARALELRAFTKQPSTAYSTDASEVMMLNPVHQLAQSLH